ncbi:hypothetical protein RRG08_052294 [Elysia crispata]|uniref:Transposase n=1 Tax=Elysia crispata TaxID=231223 RepID=A0AAE0XZ28_9GAST|nr:hypothetical protein RRG08_052294 [Elysia crispata]
MARWRGGVLTAYDCFQPHSTTGNFLRRFQTEQNDFLGRIITGDETWVYSWDPETKRQSAEWRDFDEPRPEKVRRKQGALKVMHMIFFDMNGVILRWPVLIGTTINAQYYKKVLQDKLKPAIRKKRPGLLESGILFHHDNAPVHTARAVRDVLAGYKWELLEHPRYSPDLAPCDFHLFPKMKEHLRGQRFETEQDIIQATKSPTTPSVSLPNPVSHHSFSESTEPSLPPLLHESTEPMSPTTPSVSLQNPVSHYSFSESTEPSLPLLLQLVYPFQSPTTPSLVYPPQSPTIPSVSLSIPVSHYSFSETIHSSLPLFLQ